MQQQHNLMGVDTTSGVWREVAEWATRQIQTHTVSALSLSASEQERRDAAVRIDELRSLLDAPQRSKRLMQERADLPIERY